MSFDSRRSRCSSRIGQSALALFALACAGVATQARADGEWQHTFAPYIWGAGLDGTTGLGPVTSEVDLSFSDIVETLDGGFLAHFESSRGRWAVLADVVYMDLGQNFDQGKVEIKQTIFELGGAYEVQDDFEVLFGARLNDIDVEIDRFGGLLIPDIRVQGAQTWVDPFVGGRWNPEINDRWSFQGRADIGGFGVGSDFTWNVALTLLYEKSDKITFGFGYRVLDIDYEDGEGARRFVYDAQMPGLLLGVGFNF